MFHFLASSLNRFMDEGSGEHFSRRWLRFGALDGGTFRLIVDRVEAEHLPELRALFEGVASIAGGLLLGNEIVGGDRDDGVANHHFTAGTRMLPIHVYEHSDRLIVVLEGSGVFHVSNEPLAHFSGADVRHIPVHVGDVLMFTRGLLHTFSAPVEDLLLLSYHNPANPIR